MKKYLCNAFSINMLVEDANASTDGAVLFIPLTLEEVRQHQLNFVSRIGHADTARVLSGLLGVPVPVCREAAALTAGTGPLGLDDLQVVIVAQYQGPRLPEGATELPLGASFSWWYVCRVSKRCRASSQAKAFKVGYQHGLSNVATDCDYLAARWGASTEKDRDMWARQVGVMEPPSYLENQTLCGHCGYQNRPGAFKEGSCPSCGCQIQ